MCHSNEKWHKPSKCVGTATLICYTPLFGVGGMRWMSNTKSLAVPEKVICAVAFSNVCAPLITTRKCGGYRPSFSFNSRSLLSLAMKSISWSVICRKAHNGIITSSKMPILAAQCTNSDSAITVSQ